MKATYEIDPAHSSVQFSVRHMMISNVRGAFTGVKGTVVYDSDNPSASTVEAEIDASSINTFDEKRDGHLKSADFMDVTTYPKMTFRSTRVEKAGDGVKITGDLTVHGVTKPVVLNVDEVAPEAKDPWGNTRVGASAKTKINRSEFGLSWNAALETGGFLVGDELKLEFDIELVKAKTAERLTARPLLRVLASKASRAKARSARKDNCCGCPGTSPQNCGEFRRNSTPLPSDGCSISCKWRVCCPACMLRLLRRRLAPTSSLALPRVPHLSSKKLAARHVPPQVRKSLAVKSPPLISRKYSFTSPDSMV